MTASVSTAQRISPITKGPSRVAKRPSVLSLRGLLDVLGTAVVMNRAIPDSGRISPKQLKKLQDIANTI